MACESWGCVWGLGGQGCFPQEFGGSSSVLVFGGPGGTEGLIPSCAEFLASPEGSWMWNPGWAQYLMPSVVLCHQPEVLNSCAEPCPGTCVTSLDTITGRSILWGQSGRGQTQLTLCGPSLAEPEA